MGRSKSRVKSAARSEKMRARWADPEQAKKMRAAAAKGAAVVNARKRGTQIHLEQPAPPAAAKPAEQPASRGPSERTEQGARTATRSSGAGRRSSRKGKRPAPKRSPSSEAQRSVVTGRSWAEDRDW